MKAHFIGIGGIGISAVARYYKNIGYTVSGSDKSDSELIHRLREEGINIFIGEDESLVNENTDLVVYTEAIITKPDLSIEENLLSNPELAKAKKLGIKNLSYPEALAEIVNSKKLIAVSGSHGKSTTTSMIGTMLKGSAIGGSTIVGTQLKEFGNSNFYYEDSPYFVIEACEYKRSFLKYKPYILVITNIDLDHMDYYKSLDDYISAFASFAENIVPGGFLIINGNDENCTRLSPISNIHNINLVVIKNNHIRIIYSDENISSKQDKKEVFPGIEIPQLNLQVPGEHIKFDATLAYAVGHILGLKEDYIVNKLNSYSGAWRRMEIIKNTLNGNILMSDYGHHPTEIIFTLKAIKEKYSDKKLFVVFQPHQYSRTIELLEGFKTSFDNADSLLIPDIYFSRDKKSDVEYMTTERLVNELRKNYPNTINGEGLNNSLEIIKKYDAENPNSSIILLLGAGTVDDLRYKI